MAYSNWGAFVYKNGERQHDREDVPVFGDATQETAVESGARIFVNLIKLREKYPNTEGGEWWEHAHHAVLGSGPFRLCGYKSHPELYFAKSETEIVRLKIEDYRVDLNTPPDKWDWYESDGISGEYEGYKFVASPDQDPEAVELELTEPDGTKWKSKCGYCIGAGHED